MKPVAETDRNSTNLGNAIIYGLREDLHLSSIQYSTVLTTFFITYILFDIPSNILLKKFTPRIFRMLEALFLSQPDDLVRDRGLTVKCFCDQVSFAAFVFGLITLGMGFVQNFSGLLVLRLLLGIAQAGVLPGCAYLVGSWYARKHGLRRFSVYMSATSLSSAFGGLLAATIGKMDGLLKLSGWRWLFILQGVGTCIAGVILFFTMTDFPEDATWLTEEERDYVTARLQAEQGSSAIEVGLRKRDIWNTLTDPTMVLLGLIHLCVSVPGNMSSYFAPIIVNSLGTYTPVQTQLHTAPVWVVAFGLSLIVAYVSDKIRSRYAVTIFCSFVSIIGFTILFAEPFNFHVQYGALFLAVSGIASLWPGMSAILPFSFFLPIPIHIDPSNTVEICWGAMNLGGHRRRAIGSATQIAVGNIGGIISSYCFQTEDASFRFPYAISACFCCLAAVFCTLYASCCWWRNHQRAAQGWGAGLSDHEKAMMGDRSPSYKFMI